MTKQPDYGSYEFYALGAATEIFEEAMKELRSGLPWSATSGYYKLRQAAGLGLAEAQYELAEFHIRHGFKREGKSTAEDQAEAYFWYTMAARRGSDESLAELEALATEMDEETLTEAGRRVELRGHKVGGAHRD